MIYERGGTGRYRRDLYSSYESPVVRSRATGSKKMHKPNFDADKPKPACKTVSTKWLYSEEASLLPFYSYCSNKECKEYFSNRTN